MEFRTVKIGDICEVITDYVANGSFKSLAEHVKYYDKGYARVIRLVDYNNKFEKKDSIWVSKEAYEFLKKSKLEGGEIVITNVGANLGMVFIAPKLDYPQTLGPNSIIIKTKENDKYIYYLLLSRYGQNKIKEIVSGSAMPKFNKTDFKNIIIQLPSVENQNKVVKMLSSLDKKIELNNQINDNLYKITSKLYEHIFIKNRSEEWKEYALMDIANIQNGYSYKGTELVEESEIGMATIKNFDRTGVFKEDGFKPLKPLKDKDEHYAKKFDVLVACTDLTQNADIIGNTVMLLSKNGYDKVIISMDLVKVVPKLEYINNYMLYSILSSRQFKNFALGYTSGTTVLHLNKNCFKEFSIKLPDKIEIAKFVKTVEPMYLRISEIIEENKTLEKLRDTLLPKLMNGEINLANIEI